MTTELRQRARPPAHAPDAPTIPATTHELDLEHPSGEQKYGRARQMFRQISFGLYFVLCVLGIATAQFIGAPLYWINRDLYYAYMAVTKQYFGITITTMTKWWGPTIIRVSGDASVAGQITQAKDGRVQFGFPKRLVLIANHQIYTDWLYLWWVAYANDPQTHGWIYIILKESLKYIPIIGTGMMFYGFIFMSRKMAVDQPRMAHRLRKLKVKSVDPSTGEHSLNPMWLLLFPEGTNASDKGRIKSAQWAEKMGIKDPKHLLLPRSTGMYFCLSELKGTVDYVYDCTVAYEGIPRGRFGEEFFTLSSTYFQGRPPKSVNFYWRRFPVSEIPLDTPEKFEVWLRERWYEKDELMEQFVATGRFPPLGSSGCLGPDGGADTKTDGPDFIETEVRNRYSGEVLQLFSIHGTIFLALSLVRKAWARLGLLGRG